MGTRTFHAKPVAPVLVFVLLFFALFFVFFHENFLPVAGQVRMYSTT